MKNFNWHSFHDHHGSKPRELVQHAHSHESHTFTHTHQHSHNHVVRSASSAITEFGMLKASRTGATCTLT